ncbi:Predicted transcriptional regulator [Alteracholeplasma palmae J233]|uniref:Predicted transcriptional regulator n=1 Tax=Alteracholeplasma palmae (strain ATCC 49389 / J233) TaxID=1318466 RepID=U4KJX2_ALTPJ|nr:helix-turn-helix domain-containing protein [Alteracholeplasma palmae]CCV63879.1 Predicted transcriptional regulator [Alteracholeplasma palmae J233]
MEISERLKHLRENLNLTQNQFAEKLFITRQAVSKWELGKSTPDLNTLKLISSTFNVSIESLLGIKNNLYCECCGMPLDKTSINLENSDYCKWCFTDSKVIYTDINSLVDACLPYFLESNDKINELEAKITLKNILEKLPYWKNRS